SLLLSSHCDLEGWQGAGDRESLRCQHGWGWGWMGTGPADSIPLLADELELVVQDGERRVRARQSLPEGFSWGPFQGSIHSEPASPGHGEAVRTLLSSAARLPPISAWGSEEGIAAPSLIRAVTLGSLRIVAGGGGR
uniref:Zinc finger protein ZFPM1/2 PR domain-containing protein n=1 Tax=Meleagris gallopavo TaxID=9103 RepID=A0A803Y6C0_MELGA